MNTELVTESTEMYLLRIAQLERQHSPVQIPLLAQELSVSPVSANEMCRKLTQRQLITYEPYKGVLLTQQGSTLAQQVMRHRRLWTIFLEEKLGMPAADAEELACRFEHVTSTDLAERLADFLQAAPVKNSIPLTELTAGDTGIVADTDGISALQPLGIVAGAVVSVLAVSENNTQIITVNAQKISLTAALAADIFIIPKESSHV